MKLRDETIGIASLLLVYLFWGSTFLGIRLAVETIPPLIMGFCRHGLAGLSLAALLFLLGKWGRPERREVLNAVLVGSLTAGISNGALTWSEVNVPSAYAAIAFTTMPLFLLLLNWVAFARVTPSLYDFIALPLGLIGCALVVATGESLSGGHVGAFDTFLLILCPSVWAFGSLLGKGIGLPKNILVSSALQMIAAGALLAILSVLHGEWNGFSVAAVSTRSAWGFLYLLIGGSLLGYTAFAFAVQYLDPRLVGTFGFVNPVIAMTLGYFFGEDVGAPPVLVGACLAVLSVILTFVGARRRRKA